MLELVRGDEPSARVDPGVLQPRRPAAPAPRRRPRRDGAPVQLGGRGLRRRPRGRAASTSWPRSSIVVFGPPSWRAFPTENDRRMPDGGSSRSCDQRDAARGGRSHGTDSRQPGLHTRRDAMRIWPGHPYPLGATWDGAGVNFALFAENATKVELCLFDSPDAKQGAHRIPLQGVHRQGLARLPARRPARPALRLSRPRAVRAGQGASVQPQQGRARPVRQADRPRRCSGPTSCSATSSATRQADLSFDDRDSAAVSPRWRR